MDLFKVTIRTVETVSLISHCRRREIIWVKPEKQYNYWHIFLNKNVLI